MKDLKIDLKKIASGPKHVMGFYESCKDAKGGDVHKLVFTKSFVASGKGPRGMFIETFVTSGKPRL